MFGRSTPVAVDDLRTMRRAGLVVAEGLRAMSEAAKPGVTTGEIDQVGREVLASHGATSNFLGYGADWGIQPYPGVVCLSVNEEIVHGIPGERRLEEGDVLSLDFGAIVDGWHGDACRSVIIGQGTDDDAKLLEATRESMWAGIAAAHVGGRIGDIASAVERDIIAHGERDGLTYGIIREYTGHGIGRAMHMDPDVPNYGHAGRGPRIHRNQCLCVEPMLTMGTEENATLQDDWTVVTLDGSRAAHWENTVAVTDRGLWVLTEPDGGQAELEARGVDFAPLGD